MKSRVMSPLTGERPFFGFIIESTAFGIPEFYILPRHGRILILPMAASGAEVDYRRIHMNLYNLPRILLGYFLN